MLSVIIPAYNEEDRLPATLRDTLAFLNKSGRDFEVIVVDDGSQDRTAEIVRGLAGSYVSLRLIRLAQNSGKGLAVRTGIVNAGGERILFMDADGATPVGEIDHLEEVMSRTSADIVIGSRAHQSGVDTAVEAKWFRHVAGRIFHQFVRFYGISGIADTQCGFKLFNRTTAAAIASRMRMRGYAFDVEMLWIGRELGCDIREVPVNWTHQDGSKVSVVRDGLHMVADLMRIRQNSVRGLYRTPRLRLQLDHVKQGNTVALDDMQDPATEA